MTRRENMKPMFRKFHWENALKDSGKINLQLFFFQSMLRTYSTWGTMCVFCYTATYKHARKL